MNRDRHDDSAALAALEEMEARVEAAYERGRAEAFAEASLIAKTYKGPPQLDVHSKAIVFAARHGIADEIDAAAIRAEAQKGE